MKLKASPSLLLGVLCLALFLLQGFAQLCGSQCNTTTSNCRSNCSVSRPRPPPPRPPVRPPPPRPPVRPPPPPPRPPVRPPPPTPRPPPPTPRPPPPTPRPPPPTPRPPPPTPRPPPPTPRPPPPTPRPPPPSPPTPRPPPPTPRPPPPSPPTPSPPPPSPEPPTPPEPTPPEPTPPEPTPPEPTPPVPLGELFTEEMFNEFLLLSMAPRCPGRFFYNYHAFITAAEAFPEFGNTGDNETRLREIAAFLGQTSHETAGGASTQVGPFTWGYCNIEEVRSDPWRPIPQYCAPSLEWPCAPGRFYFGRGPVQLTWNYNYGKAGVALGLDLLNNPDIVAQDPFVSFETAIWFWMTPQEPHIPSSHEVITGQWQPTLQDVFANRVPGYGLITNIFNGASECGIGPDHRGQNRIDFYVRYCDLLGVGYGQNLDCYYQVPFNPFRSKINDDRSSLSSS